MKRGKFNLSHHKLFTCKMGQLIPMTWFEVLPGDTIDHSTSALVRTAPLVTPVMHPVHVRFHHWFVPLRILWTNFENFITGGPTGMDATAHPTIAFASQPAASSLADYLGIPTTTLSNINVSALPFRAYALIYNEFYRDEDLQSLLGLSLGDGSDTTTSIALQNINWEKDYLTSSRTFEQKGPAVTVPLAGNAPIRGLGITSASSGAATSASYFDTDSTSAHTDPVFVSTIANTGLAIRAQSAAAVSATNIPQVFADLAAATGVDINVLRHSFALQRMQENRARYGSRYVELLRAWGVRSSDARLQRPEYLGGGRQVLQFSEVLQTAPTSSGTGGGSGGVGQFGGHGISALRSNRYRKFFEEHGIVMSLMSVRPKTMYSNRVYRGWLRGQAISGMVGTKEDYFQPELAHIGQQQLNLCEADISAGFNSGTFGYQDRYDEYRRMESSVAGAFRAVLDTWHLSREFASAPALNSTFVTCTPSTRVFADTSSDDLYVMANHHIRARRKLPQVGSSMAF